MRAMREGRRGGRSPRLGWLVAGVLAVVLGMSGVLVRDLYAGLIAPDTRAGALSQDIIAVVAGIALCVLAYTTPETAAKRRLIGLGLLGYLFYAYGIYAIERVYNFLYLGYLALFALAFWSLVFGAIQAGRELGPGASLDRLTRRVSAAGAVLQPAVFYPLWIAMLVPLMTERRQIDSLYSIFLLDLCFIMPAFLLVAAGTFSGRGTALVLAPVMYVLGAALILSLALGELVNPLFGQPITTSGLVPPVALTVLFAALGTWHLGRLRLSATSSPARQVSAPTA